MNVYVALCCYRHSDPVVKVFDNGQNAIDYARRFASDRARNSKSMDEQPVEGFLYYCCWSDEDEYVSVKMVELNNAEQP